MSGKLKIQQFRANDLNHDSGKQFEFGKTWCEDFFGFEAQSRECVVSLIYKPLALDSIHLQDKEIILKLAEVTGRGDRKAYANGTSGYSQIKDFFISDLHLTLDNLGDYFAVYKTNLNEYFLYYVPQLLYNNFISFFKNSNPEVTISRNKVKLDSSSDQPLQQIYRPYLTAIKSKPFLLLAGISGTGKSRIVRELAHACWEVGTKEYDDPKPRNFEMIQVKPNWHDSSELLGYVSRVSGEPVYVAGDLLRFIAKAWENKDVPHFLCLDEMNLAPVEQYFAEYLSVIESRKNKDGKIVTDAIVKKEAQTWYWKLCDELTTDENLRIQFRDNGITIPQNLIVVGTVNMDETTFSFSRKVLDRAMTIEMNEVDLGSGLEHRHEQIGLLGEAELIGKNAEGVDVYADNKEVCDTAIAYLKAINEKLEATPFKVAYRTRNEFLLYVVNNLPYNKNEVGQSIAQEIVITRALDEITCMKILSRIEGDETKVSKDFLRSLAETIAEQLNKISGRTYKDVKAQDGSVCSVSLAKIKEMQERLKSGYTSFWS